MRLPAFIDRRSGSPLRWLLFALLAATGTTTQAGWECSSQPDGLWECVSPPPAVEILPADEVTPAAGDDPAHRAAREEADPRAGVIHGG